jgi:hypothetical protein
MPDRPCERIDERRPDKPQPRDPGADLVEVLDDTRSLGRTTQVAFHERQAIEARIGGKLVRVG